MEKFSLKGEFSLPLSRFIEKKDFNNKIKIAELPALMESLEPKIPDYIKQCLREMGEHPLVEVITIKDCEILDLDSLNPYHGNAYFEFTVEGPLPFKSYAERALDGLLYTKP